MNQLKTLACLAVLHGSLCLALAACGGGGGSSSVPPTPIPATLGLGVPASGETGVAVGVTSTVLATGDLKLEWSFGDGSVSTGAGTAANASHAYAAAGEFDIALRVSNGAGQSREERGHITVSRTTRLKDFVCSGASGQGWCAITPLQTGNAMLASRFVDAQNGWAVGDNGEIQHTTDGGATWQPQSSGIGGRLNLLVFKNATEGWAGRVTPLRPGALLYTTDAGRHWSVVSLPNGALGNDDLRFDLLAGGVPRAKVGFCSVQSGCHFDTYVTTDGGASWIKGGTTTEGGISNTPIYQVEGPEGTVWSLAGSRNRGSVFKATNYGLNSSKVLEQPSTMAAQLLVFDGQSVLYVGAPTSAFGTTSEPSTVSGSSYLLTRDGGGTWQTFTPGGLPAAGRFGNWLQVTTTAGLALLGVGDDFHVSRDYGLTWTQTARKPSAATRVVSTEYLQEVKPGVLSYSALEDPNATITGRWLSTDFGRNWTRLATPSSTTAIGVSSWLGGNTLIGMGAEGQIFKSTDGGASWTEIRAAGHTPTVTTTVTQWVAVNADRLLRVDSLNQVGASTDFGQTWTALAAQPWRSAADIAFTSATQGWLLGTTGLYGTTDGGVNWKLLNKPDETGAVTFAAVHFIDELRGWALNSQWRIVASVDGGQNWAASSTAAVVPAGCSSPRLRFLSALDGALFCGTAVYVTHDGGKSWLARNLGLTATDTLAAVALIDTRTLVALTGAGSMVRSSDAGENWAPVTTLPTGGWKGMQFRKQLGWVVGNAGRMVLTQDGGATWRELTTATSRNLTRAAFIDDRTGWVTTEDGVVFATGTAGY